jgi:hypothetical protein
VEGMLLYKYSSKLDTNLVSQIIHFANEPVQNMKFFLNKFQGIFFLELPHH